MHTTRVVERFIRVLLIGLAVAMPLFVLPFTLDPIELNKHFLLYGATLMALLLWFLSCVLARRAVVERSAFDVYVLVFLGVMLVAGLFSVDRTLSFVGDYRSIRVGVIPLFFLAIYSFLVTNVFASMRERMFVLYGFIMGGMGSALWFLLDKFGFASFARFGIQASNSVSASNSEFALLLVAMLVGSVAMLSVPKRSKIVDWCSGAVALVSFVLIIAISFSVSYVLLVIGLSLLLALMLTYVEFLRIQWIIATFGLVVVGVLFMFLGVPRVFHVNLPVEVSLGVEPSYVVAWQTLTDNVKQFLIGSGPSTFVYDFSQHRPESLNMNGFAWRVRFAQPYATFVSMLAESGVVGVVSFVFLVLVVVGFIGSRWLESISGRSSRTSPFDERTAAMYLLAPVWMMITISFFFLHASIVLWFVWFVLLAILSTAMVHGAPERYSITLSSSPQYVLATSFAVIVLFAGGIVFGVFAGRYFAAEVLFSRAQRSATSPSQQIAFLSSAVRLNDNNARYSIALAQALLSEAQLVAGRADASGDLIGRLVTSAVERAQMATNIAPRDVGTWETLARMYANATSFAPGVEAWVTKSYERAVELEPTNPVLHVQLGMATYKEGRGAEAREHFEEAVALKPNYLDAYLQLAAYHEGEGDLSAAITTLGNGLGAGRQSDAYLFQLGRLYYNRAEEGDWDRAIELFQVSIDLNPNNVNSWFSLGLVYDRRGDRERALRHFEEVLKRDPGHEAVKSRVKQLRAILGIQ